MFSPHPLDLQALDSLPPVVPAFPGYAADSAGESNGGSDSEEELAETMVKRKTRSKKGGVAKKPKKDKKTEPSDHHNPHFQTGYDPDTQITEKQVTEVLAGAPVPINLFPSHIQLVATNFVGTFYIRSFLGHCTNCSFMFPESTTNLHDRTERTRVPHRTSLFSPSYTHTSLMTFATRTGSVACLALFLCEYFELNVGMWFKEVHAQIMWYGSVHTPHAHTRLTDARC